MLRHPFMRAVSGFLYRGHNPNFDVFQLRPGLFHSPKNPRSPTATRSTPWRFEEFATMSEYTNVMTKMFGASKHCDQVTKCHAGTRDKGIGSPCLVTSHCHAYRNATFLNEEHMHAADTALALHEYVGLVEAYDASLTLLGAHFGLNLTAEFFTNARPSPGSKQVCKSLQARRIRSDKGMCRLLMEHSRMDALLYERAHRRFCAQLDRYGLRHRPEIVRELDKANLCGALDFSDPQAFCSFVASPAEVAKVVKDEVRCKKRS